MQKALSFLFKASSKIKTSYLCFASVLKSNMSKKHDFLFDQNESFL